MYRPLCRPRVYWTFQAVPLRGSWPPDSLKRNSAVTSCAGGSGSVAAGRIAERRPRATRRPGPEECEERQARIGGKCMRNPRLSHQRARCRPGFRRPARIIRVVGGPWAACLGLGLGRRRLDLARRQVDLRARIAQVALADAVGQVNDPIDPRVVLERELAELRVDAELACRTARRAASPRRSSRERAPGLLRIRRRRAACGDAGRPRRRRPCPCPGRRSRRP